MGKKNRFKGKPCVYCGKDAETEDHIPPQSLFDSIPPSQLISVPSCFKCNNKASIDDEYFRTVHGILETTFENPEVQKILPSVHRGLFHPKKKKFLKSFMKTLRLEDRYTPSGIFLGKAPAFTVNTVRLERVVQRITCGLYYCETNDPLPRQFEIRVHWAGHFTHDITDYGQRLNRLAGYVLSKSCKSIGTNVFDYWVSFFDEFEGRQPYQSLWLLRFYGAVDYLAMTFSEQNPTEAI